MKEPCGVSSLPGVVAGGYGVKPLLQGVIQKDAELHFPVAQHVRIGRVSGAVAFNQVIHDAGAVFVHQVDDPEFNADFLATDSAS